MNKDSQVKQILKLLRKNTHGTPNWRLAEVSLKYSSRIAEMRNDGYVIVADRLWNNGHATGVWLYYLKEGVGNA